MFPFGGPSEKAHEGPRRNVPAVYRKCPDKQTVPVADTKKPRSSFRSMLLFSTLPSRTGIQESTNFVRVPCRVICFLIFSTRKYSPAPRQVGQEKGFPVPFLFSYSYSKVLEKIDSVFQFQYSLRTRGQPQSELRLTAGYSPANPNLVSHETLDAQSLLDGAFREGLRTARHKA